MEIDQIYFISETFSVYLVTNKIILEYKSVEIELNNSQNVI